jgi:hypothetical protein
MADHISEDEIQWVYREIIDTLYGFVSRRCGGQSGDAELPLLVVRGFGVDAGVQLLRGTARYVRSIFC